MVLSRGNLHAGQREPLSTRGTAAKNSRPESERLLLLWQYRTKIVWYCLRARVHRRLSTSFRQILLHTALKILAIRKYACKFLPCLQKNLLENPHIFPTNTSSENFCGSVASGSAASKPSGGIRSYLAVRLWLANADCCPCRYR